MTDALAGYGLPYWLDIDRPAFPVLDRDLTADAVIIGAGIFGLKVARYLSQAGLTCIVLEGARVGEGASGRNQGSANHGASISYAEAITRYGRAKAKAIWQLGLENHRLIREQLNDYGLQCDYRAAGFTFLARRDMPDGEATAIAYRREYDLLSQDGFAVEALDAGAARAATGSDLYLGGLRYRTDAQFHSGRYVVGLGVGVSRMPGVSLFEGTRVTRIVRDGSVTRVTAGDHSVSAPLVFLGLNALAPQFIAGLAPGMRAERGQVIVTEPLPERPCDGAFGTAMAWWRELPEPDGRYRLLFGGGRRREEPDSLFHQYERGQPNPIIESEGFSPSSAHQGRLDEQLRLLFPQYANARITHRWGGLQSFTADGFPQVGLFDEERKIYGAAGFSGRGNCYSDVAAAHVVGRATRRSIPLDARFISLIDEIMPVRRASAVWAGWSDDGSPTQR